jgi:hypothetical protein
MYSSHTTGLRELPLPLLLPQLPLLLQPAGAGVDEETEPGDSMGLTWLLLLLTETPNDRIGDIR